MCEICDIIGSEPQLKRVHSLRLTGEAAAAAHSSALLLPGQHIYTYRRFGACIYTHHGIYEGNGMVIHLTRTHGRLSLPLLPPSALSAESGTHPYSTSDHLEGGSCGVVRVCLDCFRRDGSIVRPVRVYTYGVQRRRPWPRIPGTCTTAAATRSPDQVLRTAQSLLSSRGFGDYDLLRNNCEHFATYCVTGERISEQADRWARIMDTLMQLSRPWSRL